MRMLWRRNDLVCREVVELITDYLEGALPRAQRRRLEEHLRGCDHCGEYLRQIEATIELTGRLRSEDLPPRLREELIAVYRSWLASGA
jgi:anti-sigma factor RsiW